MFVYCRVTTQDATGDEKLAEKVPGPRRCSCLHCRRDTAWFLSPRGSGIAVRAQLCSCGALPLTHHLTQTGDVCAAGAL